MTLKVPYKRIPTAPGGFELHAILNVQIALPEQNARRTKRFEALIDSWSFALRLSYEYR